MDLVNKKTRRLFEILSHPARLRLLELLAARPRKNRELAKLLKINESSLSHHIQHLREVPGLLVTERDGQQVMHSIDRNIVAEALVELGKAASLDVVVR